MKQKIKKYRRIKKMIQKRKQRQRILGLVSIGTKVWFLQKKLTLLILIWITSCLGYNAGNNSLKEQIWTSKNEINRLKKNLEELPELQSRIQTQQVKLQEFQEKGEEFRIKSVKNNQTLVKAKKEQESLEKIIHELECQSTKDNLILKRYKKDLKENTDKFKREIEIIKKKNTNLNQELQDSQKELQITKSDLKLKQKDLEEQIILFQTQANKDLQLIEDLQEKLNKKEKEFSELIEIREKLRNVTEKLQSLENKGQLEKILLILDKILSPTLFRYIKIT